MVNKDSVQRSNENSHRSPRLKRKLSRQLTGLKERETNIQIQKECFRLIHTLNKKLRRLDAEVNRMRSIVAEEEIVHSPDGEPLSPRLAVQPRSTSHNTNGMSWGAASAKRSVGTMGNSLTDTLTEARAKFEELDVNGNGALEDQELLALTDWCWKNFPVVGDIRTTQKKQAAQALLERTDHNRDGKMDFDEFAEWFVQHINKFKRIQRQKKQENKRTVYSQDESSSEDGLDDEVIVIRKKPPVRNEVSPRRDELDEPSPKPNSRPSPAYKSTPSKPNHARRAQAWANSPMMKNLDSDSHDVSRNKYVESPKSPIVASVSVNHRFSLGDKSPSSRHSRQSSYARKTQTTTKPLAASSPKRRLSKNAFIRRQRTKELEEPWLVLSGFKTPAKNRVQLFLRLNTSRNNKLGPDDLKPLLIKAGVQKEYLGEMLEAFTAHFNSTDGTITYKQFEKVMPGNANERQIFDIVKQLTSKLKS